MLNFMLERNSNTQSHPKKSNSSLRHSIITWSLLCIVAIETPKSYIFLSYIKFYAIVFNGTKYIN